MRYTLVENTASSILTFNIVGIQLSFSSRHLSTTSKANGHAPNLSA